MMNWSVAPLTMEAMLHANCEITNNKHQQVQFMIFEADNHAITSH